MALPGTAKLGQEILDFDSNPKPGFAVQAIPYIEATDELSPVYYSRTDAYAHKYLHIAYCPI